MSTPLLSSLHKLNSSKINVLFYTPLHAYMLYNNCYIYFQVLIMPGVLTQTNFARPSSIKKGGPLGELVQWSDLISSIYVLGHNVTLMWNLQQGAKW